MPTRPSRPRPAAKIDTQTGLPVREAAPRSRGTPKAKAPKVGAEPSSAAEASPAGQAPASSPASSERARALAIDVARLLKDDKCEDVMLLDLRALSPVTDFFVIGTGTSDRQMRSAAEHAGELGESQGQTVYRSNMNEGNSNWLVLDFVDVVVHVFAADARRYYDLEALWSDAPRLAWERGSPEADAPLAAPERNRAGLSAGDRLPRRRAPRSSAPASPPAPDAPEA